MIREGIARIYWRFSRWTLHNEPQPDTPRIILGVPHTSNWDFVFMLAICWRSHVPLRWLGKHTLFAGWRGPLMRALGGIPVDRANPGGIVEEPRRILRACVEELVELTPNQTSRLVVAAATKVAASQRAITRA